MHSQVVTGVAWLLGTALWYLLPEFLWKLWEALLLLVIGFVQFIASGCGVRDGSPLCSLLLDYCIINSFVIIRISDFYGIVVGMLPPP